MEKVDLLKIEAADSAITALLDLVTVYRPNTPLPTVTRFQKAWLALYPYIRNDSAFRRPDGQAEVSGLYGARTGREMENFVLAVAYKLGMPVIWDSQIYDRVLPKRAVDLPEWGRKNATLIEAMHKWLYNLHNPAPAPAPTPTPSPAPQVQPQPTPAPVPTPTTQQTVLMRMTPYQEDNTKLYVAAGLTVVGLGAVYWFVLRKKKKSRRR